MNIILFEPTELCSPLPRDDARVIHILDVLRRQPGDATDVGLVNGPRGKAILRTVDEQQASFDFVWGDLPSELLPIDLIVGLSRPQTSRKILQEATSLGARRILFVTTDRGEPSYAQSKLWTTNEWQRMVRAGVEQAFSTRFPDVEVGLSLTEAIVKTSSSSVRICLDNYESTSRLAAATAEANSVVLAVGSERGWSAAERNQFREHGFVLADLGERPLRSETATIAAVSIVAGQLSDGVSGP